MSGPGVQISSPGYPDNYPNSMDCAWLISFEQDTARVSAASRPLLAAGRNAGRMFF